MSFRIVIATGLITGNLIGLGSLPFLAAHTHPLKSVDAVAVDGTTLPDDQTKPVPETTAEPLVPAPAPVAITEILVDPVTPQTDVADEFIELHNPNDTAIDVTGYKLATAHDSFVLPQTLMEPNGYVSLPASTTHIALTNTGGTLGLIGPDGQAVADKTWQAAVAGATWARFDDAWHWTGTPTPAAANELKLVGAEAAAASKPSPTPTPSARPVVPPAAASSSAGGDAGRGSVAPTVDVPAPLITELMPDPVAPATDADNEFIELYNGASEPFNLQGYVLKTGKTFADHYAFGALILEPGQYYALTSKVSGLGLTNTGSSVALFDPSGGQVGDVVSYEDAKPGQSWVLQDGIWTWTTTPTPAAMNLLTVPVSATTAAKAASTSTASKSSTSTANKVTASKAVTTPKATKTPQASAAPKAKAAKPLVAGTSTSNGHWLLFVLVGLTIAYIIYEFRHDLLGYYHDIRRNAGARRTVGPIGLGRGNNRATERPGRGQDNLRDRSHARPVIQW